MRFWYLEALSLKDDSKLKALGEEWLSQNYSWRAFGILARAIDMAR